MHFGTIGPGQSKRNGWLDAPELWHVMHIGPGCPGHAWHLDLEFVFTDNCGARWRRNGEQQPVQLLPSDDVVEEWKRRQKVIEEERRLANERLAADPDVIAPRAPEPLGGGAAGARAARRAALNQYRSSSQG
jgi:hypothetical protein